VSNQAVLSVIKKGVKKGR